MAHELGSWSVSSLAVPPATASPVPVPIPSPLPTSLHPPQRQLHSHPMATRSGGYWEEEKLTLSPWPLPPANTGKGERRLTSPLALCPVPSCTFFSHTPPHCLLIQYCAHRGLRLNAAFLWLVAATLRASPSSGGVPVHSFFLSSNSIVMKIIVIIYSLSIFILVMRKLYTERSHGLFRVTELANGRA